MAEKTAYFFLRTSVGKEAEVFIRKFDDGAPENDPLLREKDGEK